jgi:hypothetical protein
MLLSFPMPDGQVLIVNPDEVVDISVTEIGAEKPGVFVRYKDGGTTLITKPENVDYIRERFQEPKQKPAPTLFPNQPAGGMGGMPIGISPGLSAATPLK